MAIMISLIDFWWWLVLRYWYTLCNIDVLCTMTILAILIASYGLSLILILVNCAAGGREPKPGRSLKVTSTIVMIGVLKSFIWFDYCHSGLLSFMTIVFVKEAAVSVWKDLRIFLLGVFATQVKILRVFEWGYVQIYVLYTEDMYRYGLCIEDI